MKRIALLLYTLLLFGCFGGRPTYDITRYGARTSKANNAVAINKAIDDCHRHGGGTVTVPEGTFITGTVIMKGGVTLHLDKGATLKAIECPDDYTSMTAVRDLSKFDSGDGTQNSNNSRDARWNRALILASGVSDIAIEGEGTIDGCHVYDPEGEEHMRGPHTILFSDTENSRVEGISIIRAANYAFMAYAVKNAVFSNLDIREGWDGIHIRGGENIDIKDCSFKTGDDAIAGGYWEGMNIHGCDINSSCNGIRIIMPVTDVEIDSCSFHGPGEFPHRTSGERRRCNMLAAINIQPGGWGRADGDIDNVFIKDISVDNVATPLMVNLNENNNCGAISVEKMTATRVYGAPVSIESWKGGEYETVRMKDVSVDFIGNDDHSLASLPVCPPPADYRPLPCWALFAKNIRTLDLENVSFSLSGKDSRPALLLDSVAEKIFDLKIAN